ncbi:MAG TPA: hypothetical protein VKG92_05550 [Flavobacteriales bacterium]|nr:hypothetical protein [Flavobacteriales bacterium]
MNDQKTCAHVNMRSFAHDGARLPFLFRPIVLLFVFIGAHAHMGTCAFGQSTGKLRLNVQPIGSTEYVVDGKYRMRDQEITLEQGRHRFIFWAPERRMLDTTLTVIPDRTTEISLQLRYSQEFIDHRQATERYTLMNRWGRIAPPIITAGFGAWAVASYFNYKEANDELVDLGDTYSTSTDPGYIRSLKGERIPNAKDEFEKARTQFYVSSGLFVASLGATLYLRHRFATTKAPVFEDKEKLRFDGLVWMPTPNGGGTWATTVSLPIR